MRNSVLIILILIIFSTGLICEYGIKSEESFLEPETPTGHFVYEDFIEEPSITEPSAITEPSSIKDLPIPETTPEPVDMAADVRCVDDRIELMFTNPTNDTLTLVKDVIIEVNGMVVVDPECNILTIKPKKKALCIDISGHLPIKEGKENTVQLSTKTEKVRLVVDCGNQ